MANINGTSGEDVLEGGQENDVLKGGNGSDTYIFNRGGGSDLIDDGGSNDADVVKVVGYNFADVIFTQINSDHATADGGLPDGDTLVLTFTGSTDRLEVFNTLDDSPLDQIESFVFDDRTLTIAEIKELLINQQTTDGDDTIKGYLTEDTINGGLGNDTIYSNKGDDTLEGGKGNDTLIGGDGSDTYIFNRGDGSDLIDDGGSDDADVVKVVGYNFADVIFTQINSDHATADNGLQNGDTLVLTFTGTTDRLDVFNTLDASPPDQIESFVFDDQTLTIAEIRTLLYEQSVSDGDDTIYGFTTDDTIEGGKGNDILLGADGSDTYVFNRGDGSDIIHDYGNHDTDVVKVVGYNLDEVTFSQINSDYGSSDGSLLNGDTLVITFAGTTDRIEVYNTLDDSTYDQIESFEFDDQTLSIAAINTILTEGQATDGDDNINGTSNNDVIDALAGNDTVNAGAGNDTLTGGLGDDTIEGGDGEDVYIYNRGDGNDTYTEADRLYSSYNDKVLLNNIDPSDVSITLEGNDFILTIAESAAGAADGGSIRLVNSANDYYERGIESVTFGNDADTIWGRNEIRALMLAAVSTEGDDNIVGTTGHETIDALAGDDTINAGAGNDTITGGLGDDTIEGGDGEDVYIYNRGDGNDTYTEADRLYSSYSDKVVLNNIDPSDVTVTQENNDFILTIAESAAGAGDGGSIRLTDTANDYYERGIESVTFGNDADTIWTRAELRGFILAATITEGDDNITGYTSNDTIDALGGNDTINAGNGNDTLTGGLGDDTIEGGDGADTYIYNRGDGNDTYTEADRLYSSYSDKVVLNNIDPSDVTVTQENNDFILTIAESAAGAGDGGSIRLTDTANDYYERGIESVTFGNDADTIWTRAELRGFILAATITEGDDNITGYTSNDTIDALGGNDTINAGNGNDTLTGGLGDDTIEGGDGADTYIYNRGDGNDTYTEADRLYSSYSDKVVLNNIDPSDVTVTQENNDFILTIAESAAGAGDGGSIRLTDTANDYYERGIESVTFGNDADTIWTRAELRGFILAATITEGDDNITGYTSNDTIDALGGNDTINAGNGNDTLTGGLGDDTIEGGDGADTYIYNRGDGNDTYTEADRLYSSYSDKVVLNNIDPSDVSVSQVNNDFILTIADSATDAGDGGSIRLVDSANDYYERGIESVTFGNDADTIWGRDKLRELVLANKATEGDDNIIGTNGDETIDALGGNDTVNAGGGDDTLTGGLGNDTIEGGDGDDTYIYNRGDGNDIYTEDSRFYSGNNDTVILNNIDPSDVTVTQMNNDFILTIAESAAGAGDGGTIRLVNSANDNYERGLERVTFGNDVDTIWTRAELRAFVLAASITEGDDNITGYTSDDTIDALGGNDSVNAGDGDDTITGGLGNDALSGGDGSDTYIFNRGDGMDFINDNGFNDTDVLKLVGYNLADVNFTQFNNPSFTEDNGLPNGDTLVLTFNGTADRVEVINTLDGSETDQIESFVFDDQTLTLAQVKLLIDNQNPVANDDEFTTKTSDLLTITTASLLANDSDENSDPLTVISVQDAVNGTVEINSDGDIEFTPATDFTGDATFTYTISDGRNGTDIGTVMIDVIPDNSRPIVGDIDLGEMVEGETLTITTAQLLAEATDPDDDDDMSISAVSVDPADGTIVDNGDGTYTFTPATDKIANDISINFTVTDGALDAQAQALIDVLEANSAPIVENPIADTASDEDTPFTYTIDASTFSDADGDDLAYSATLEGGAALPSWLAFNADTRTLSGTPPLNFHGDLSVTVTASDGRADASDTFTLDITPVNDAPQLDNPVADQTSEEDTAVSFTIPADAFSDVDGDELTYTAKLEDGSELPSWLAFDATALTFSGTPPLNFHGALSVTVTATDPGGLEAFDTIGLEITPVNDAPQLDNPVADQSSPEDTAVSFTIPADAFSDADGDDLAYSATLEGGAALPSWLAFNADTRTLSGTPPLNFHGDLSVTVTASDGRADASDTFTLDITPVNDAPQLDNPVADQTSEEDTAVSFTIPADAFSDVDGDELTYTAKLEDGSELPSWLAFDATALTFSGTPPLNFHGALSVTVTATDPGGLEAFDTIGLEITPVNDAPQLDNPVADQSSPEDTAVSFTIPADAFSDVDGDELTYSAKLEDGSELPSWLAFDATALTFSGTPPLNFHGALSVTVTATDPSGLEAFDTIGLEITPVNDAPQLDSPVADQTSEEDTAVSFTIPADTFSDVDGDELTYSAKLEDGSELPSWLAFDATALTFSGTPPLNFHGALSVTVTATDPGGLEAFDTIELEITPVNDAPVLANPLDDQIFDEDTEISFTIPADAFSDVDNDELTYSAVLLTDPPESETASIDDLPSTPLPFWLTFNADTLTFSGTPPEDHHSTRHILVTASDGEFKASDIFVLEITSINDAPVAGDDDGFETTAGTALTIAAADLLANDIDPDGDSISVYELVQPENGQVEFDENGNVVYTPNAGFTGEDIFTYILFDTKGATDSATVSVTVAAGNAAPVLDNELADQTSEEDTALSFTIPNDAFSDPDDDELTYSAGLAEALPQNDGGSASADEPATVPLPDWLTFDPETLTFSGTPPLNFFGTIDVVVTATDPDGLSESDTFTLEITPVNDAPVLAGSLDDQTSEEDTAVSFTIPEFAFTDVDNTLTFRTSTLPAWLAFDASTLTFSGTPPLNYNGTIDVTVTASDGEFEVSDTFALEITPVNDAPVAVDDDGIEADAGTALTIAAADLLANDSDVEGDDLSIVAVNSTSGNAEVSLDGDGNVVYTASGDFDGDDSFTYTVSDGNGGTATATVSVSVEGDEANPYEGWHVGTTGNDNLYGSFFSSNQIYGDAGNDRIFGGFRSDELDGGEGNDRIYGRWGNDIINGDGGDDRIYGGSGNDTLNGGDGNDRLYGSWGNDTLNGGEGNDQIWGGWGQDNFVFNTGDGDDTVRDFSTGFSWWWFRSAGDTITLDVDGIENYDDVLEAASQNGRHTTFDFGDGDSLTLNYTRLSSLDQDDFTIL